jgi:hypothetical protein
MVKNPSKKEKISYLYKEGWTIAKKNFWPLLAVILISFAIGMIFDGKDKIFFEIIAFIGTIFITRPIELTASWITLKAVRKKKYKIREVFSVFKRRNYLDIVLGGVLSIIFTVLGLILLIIPGIIVAIRLSFVPYLLFDKEMKAMEAIKKSWKLTRGYSWKILGISLLGVLIFLVGFILLILPAFFALVWITTTFAVFYNIRISSKK